MTQLLRDTGERLVEVPPSTIEKQARSCSGRGKGMRFNIQDASGKIGADPRLADVLRPATNVFKKGTGSGPGGPGVQRRPPGNLGDRGDQEAPHEAELELRRSSEEGSRLLCVGG